MRALSTLKPPTSEVNMDHKLIAPVVAREGNNWVVAGKLNTEH